MDSAEYDGMPPMTTEQVLRHNKIMKIAIDTTTIAARQYEPRIFAGMKDQEELWQRNEASAIAQEEAAYALRSDPRKFDSGKLKYSLILPEFLELMAEILTKGEINHPPEPDGTPSWQHVEPERYVDALTRHLQSYRMGESEDSEMGTHHCGHIAVNALFLWWLDTQKKEG